MLPNEADYFRLPDKTFFTLQTQRNDSKSCETLQHLHCTACETACRPIKREPDLIQLHN